MKAKASRASRRPEGAAAMPYRPLPGTVWTLRDVLPRVSTEYRGTVETVWHDADGRLLAQFTVEDGQRPLLEVWVQRAGGEP